MKFKIVSILLILIISVCQSATFSANEKIKLPDKGLITDIVLFKDNKHIAFFDALENEITIFNIKNKKNINKISHNKDLGYLNIATINNKKDLLTMDEKGNITIWDIKTRKKIKTIKSLTEQDSTIFSLSKNSKYLYINSKNGIKVFDMGKGIELKTLNTNKKEIKSMQVSNDDKFLFFASNDNIIYKKDLTSGKIVKKFKGHKKKINSLKITKDNKTLLSGSNDGTIIIWDSIRGKKLRTIKIKGKYSPYEVDSIELSPNSKYVLSSVNTHNNDLWEIKTGKLIRSFDYFLTTKKINFSSKGDFVLFNFLPEIEIFNTKISTSEIKPFGISIGKKLAKSIKSHKYENSNMRKISNPPKPNKIFDTYGASLNKNKIVISVASTGQIHLNDDYCYTSSADYSSIKKILSNKYGMPSDYANYLRSGSIWDERAYYKMSFYKNERVHYDIWDNIEANSEIEIMLEEDATSNGCYIRLTYINKRLQKEYEKNLSKVDSGSF